jgi:hypothetical protein
MTRTLIVSAADESFMPWLRRLADSLRTQNVFSLADFAIFDLGLGEGSCACLAGYGAKTVIPGWDLPVDEELARSKPHLRALTVRPFLPRYFPGYDTYLWIDSDAWVQSGYAIEWLLAAAQQGALAAVPEVDRSYIQLSGIWSWRFEWLKAYYGNDAAQKLISERYLNTGVFALRGDAPHWHAWEHWFGRGIDATKGEVCNDQTALNHAIWTEGLPVHPLPALCNWLCHLAPPVFNQDTGLFHEPYIPCRPIGILHETGEIKGEFCRPDS